MKTLYLNVPLKTRRGATSSLKESEGQGWKWENGLCIVRLAEEPGSEYVLPPTSVKYEQRDREQTQAAKK